MRLTQYALSPEARFEPPLPAVQRSVRFGQTIFLRGYDLAPESGASRDVELTLYWTTDAPVDASFHVFVHLLGPGGMRYGQDDGLPGNGAFPTDEWLPMETILDVHHLELPADAPDGEYTLAVGLYDLATMVRLEALDATGMQISENRVLIDVPWTGRSP
jgi:hypothetical protein